MNIPSITDHKKDVDQYLGSFLAQKKQSLSGVNSWSVDVIKRLEKFIVRGKTIRGSLAMFSYSLFSKEDTESVLRAAAALELFQAGFLIHDDIMDQDDNRRGDVSVHAQYEQLLANTHIGMSMGINAADLCFFFAYELLEGLPVIKNVSEELSKVVIAQMQDVSAVARSNALTKEDVMSLYTYKTARYSFSLPLFVGATLANAPAHKIKTLESLGEHMGILFQISDDTLSRSKESDVRNNKQTLSSLVSAEELKSIVKHHEQAAHMLIALLNQTSQHRDALESLVAFCKNRV